MTPAGARAFLALWNSIDTPALQPEYETWHAFEHVPERVGLPGFIEARRYRCEGPGPGGAAMYFTCYWLDAIAALDSDDYHQVFAQPTAWTARLRGHLSEFFRLPCVLRGSHGQSSASQLACLHLRGDLQALAPVLEQALDQAVQRGDLVCAQWGAFAQTQAIPIANRAGAQPAPAPGQDCVLMLQGLDGAALARQAQVLAYTLSPLARVARGPELFALQSVVRQDALLQRPPARQPPRPELMQLFESRVAHQKGDPS
ncbi:MAG TPA: hypothetical protein VLJ58_13120 [Ramlibacter sp.]|nr:hypothetical protein [Ramlibacter sp.]